MISERVSYDLCAPSQLVSYRWVELGQANDHQGALQGSSSAQLLVMWRNEEVQLLQVHRIAVDQPAAW